MLNDFIDSLMVGMGRLELPRRKALDPKSSVYTNFTTSPFFYERTRWQE